MKEQRISVETRHVKVIFNNGDRLSGELFLQMHGRRLIGPQCIGEVLNGEDCFVPMRHDGQIDLINLEQIVSVSSSAEEEVDDLLRLGKEQQVQVLTTTGPPMNLRTYINLPSSSSRMKDFMNQKKKFLLFLHEDQVIYLAREEIIRVID